MKTIFVGINSKYIHTNLGLRYINAYCRKQGLNTELLEETINTPSLTVLAKIVEQAPDIIGLDVHIWNRVYVFELVELLRKVLPCSLIILGGPEVMFDPARALEQAPGADAVICGEGELLAAKALALIEENGGHLPKLVGLATKENLAEAAAWAPLVVENMDLLPFPYPDLDQVLEQHKICYYECTRGCPFHCSYCLSGISHTVRRRSLEKVLADMDRFIAAGIPLLKFVDRTYNLDESYFLPIMEHLAKADTRATFHFEIKADILTPRVIEFLRSVPKGRFQLEIGVQSTSPKTLQAIGRQDNWQQLAYNVRELLQAKNMHIHMDLIAGLPYEGLAEFGKSFEDVYSLRPDMLQLGFLKVLPGTRMAREQEQHQLCYMEQPPYEILKTRYMPYEELRLLKILEDVFDLLANSGRFTYSVDYLCKSYEGAFAFFTAFTKWYKEGGYFGVGHTGNEMARLLWEFVNSAQPQLVEELREILRLDVLMNLPGYKPEWLGWNTEKNFKEVSDFWRLEEQVQQYLPEYSFKNWRAVHKSYAIEEFSYNPVTAVKEKVYFLYDYQKKVLTRISLCDSIYKSSNDGK